MNGPSWLGVAVALLILVVFFELLRRRHLREKYAVVWGLVALGTIVAAVEPRALVFASEVVGIAVPSNFVFFAASILLLLVSVHYSYELTRLEAKSRTLAEEVALLRMELNEVRGRPEESAPPAEEPDNF